MNKLKLNPDKTEFLLIGNERQRSKFLSMFAIELFDVKTNPVKSAGNLEVIFDENFTFRLHISAVCSSYFYHIQNLRCFAITLIWVMQNYLQLLLCKSFLLLCCVSPKQPDTVCTFTHFSCYLQETSEDISLWLGLSPLDTGIPYGPVMPQNCFIDFAVEQ